MAATPHDLGYVVHRHDHVYYSIPLAADVLDRVLREFYDVGDAVGVKRRSCTPSSVTTSRGSR